MTAGACRFFPCSSSLGPAAAELEGASNQYPSLCIGLLARLVRGNALSVLRSIGAKP